MKLNDLLSKPVHECSDEELEERIRMARSMRFEKPKKTKTASAPRSNKAKRTKDLLSKCAPEELELIREILAKRKEGK